MLVWDRSYDGTGHVAIITDVGERYVRIAEQNFEDWKWDEGADYARSAVDGTFDGIFDGIIDRIWPLYLHVCASMHASMCMS